MSAREWLLSTFPNDGENIVIANRGDFQKYNLPGVDPLLMPEGPVNANIDLFLAWFGSAIEAGLNYGSIYAALTDATVQQRGYRPYFELWKAKGLIN